MFKMAELSHHRDIYSLNFQELILQIFHKNQRKKKKTPLCSRTMFKSHLEWKLTGCDFVLPLSGTAPRRSFSTQARRRSTRPTTRGGSIQMAPWRRSTLTASRKRTTPTDDSGSKTKMATSSWTTDLSDGVSQQIKDFRILRLISELWFPKTCQKSQTSQTRIKCLSCSPLMFSPVLVCRAFKITLQMDTPPLLHLRYVHLYGSWFVVNTFLDYIQWSTARLLEVWQMSWMQFCSHKLFTHLFLFAHHHHWWVKTSYRQSRALRCY